ncbi:TetR family transcriptional regulator [Cellulomonas sp. P22]|uniref:TetR/AcrR family transcriptional regulator n=1 Tax=Cellulomonas sp. P22 TaxID=3373189 RepID=UPI0037A461B9
MGTAQTVDGRPSSDLTARARIRDAAIECFARDGFEASFRSIATRVDVSPGLITHHFGSKATLRAECDAEVLRQYRLVKADAITRPSAHLLEALAAPGLSGTLLVYILRAIHAGGQPAREFLDHLMADVRGVMADAVASGLVRPSRDEEARLRHLTYQTMGALLVEFVTSPGLTPDEFVAALHAGTRESVLPTLELFSEGLLTSTDMLDDYLTYRGRHPADEAPPGETERAARPT